jgi:hypothetical protein
MIKTFLTEPCLVEPPDPEDKNLLKTTEYGKQKILNLMLIGKIVSFEKSYQQNSEETKEFFSKFFNVHKSFQFLPFLELFQKLEIPLYKYYLFILVVYLKFPCASILSLS